jgi:transglutaminase-like putative cysteine protease
MRIVRLLLDRPFRSLAAILSFLLSVFIVVSIVFSPSAIAQRNAKRDVPDIATVRIEASQVPLSSGPTVAAGIIEPLGENVVSDGDVKLDLSLLDKGYFYVSYEGSRSELRFELYNVETEDAPPLYAYPAEKGWQGYALPSGPGIYTLRTYALDTGTDLVQPEDIKEFTFGADFAEEEPYRYRNAYSYYEEESLAVTFAAYLIDEETRKQGRSLTDAEKTEILIAFIQGNITWDYTLLEQVETGEQQFYFPDCDTTLSTEQGLCSDWASLTAVMLKSSGIPTRLHDGYILKSDGEGEGVLTYHTWLSIYFDESWHMYDPSFSSEEIQDNKTTQSANSGFAFVGNEKNTSIEYQIDKMILY